MDVLVVLGGLLGAGGLLWLTPRIDPDRTIAEGAEQLSAAPAEAALLSSSVDPVAAAS